MEARLNLATGTSRIPAPQQRASGDFSTLNPRSREQEVFTQQRSAQRASWAPRGTNHRSRSEQKFSPTIDKSLYETETRPQTNTRAFRQTSRTDQLSIPTLDTTMTRSCEALGVAAEAPTLGRRVSRSSERQSFEIKSFEASTARDMPIIDYSAPTNSRRSSQRTIISRQEYRTSVDPSTGREVAHLHRRASRRMEVEDRVDSMNRMHSQLQEKFNRLSAQNVDLRWALEQERTDAERKNWEIQNLTLAADIQEELKSAAETNSEVNVEDLQEKLAIESSNRQKFEDQVEIVVKCMETRDEKITSLKEELATTKAALEARGKENRVLIQKLEEVLKKQQMIMPTPLPKEPAWKIWRSASTKKRR